MVRVYTDIDLDDIDDDDLVEEMNARGYKMRDSENDFTSEELDEISNTFASSQPGTVGYEIYLKAKK